MANTPGIGLAHLTLLQLTPPEMVLTAAEAGFGYVGLRLRPAAAGERGYPMAPGQPMVKQTADLLASTGVRVLDTEVLTLDGRVTRETWLPVLEVAALLHARTLTVIAADEDPGRLRARFAELAEDATQFGVRPAIEPITYRSIRSVPTAAELAATAPGAGVVIDALHLTRFGGTPAQVAELGDRLAMVQLCDGPAATPVGLPRPPSMPLGQRIDGADLQVEARAVRVLPGQGEFALVDLVRAVPAGVPFSVEAPNVALVQEIGSAAYARAALLSALDVLARSQHTA